MGGATQNSSHAAEGGTSNANSRLPEVNESGEGGEEESERRVSLPAEEPVRRRSRRRASQVLLSAQATADKGMHVPSLLERYQVSSLACCDGLTSVPPLRELICNIERNTELQNYKLSHEREPGQAL